MMGRIENHTWEPHAYRQRPASGQLGFRSKRPMSGRNGESTDKTPRQQLEHEQQKLAPGFFAEIRAHRDYQHQTGPVFSDTERL